MASSKPGDSSTEAASVSSARSRVGNTRRVEKHVDVGRGVKEAASTVNQLLGAPITGLTAGTAAAGGDSAAARRAAAGGARAGAAHARGS